ncbi:MAG: hypothetical protein IPH44_04910 [Myxococcales bacterium]|nr:hypothetical protein [Myxococcales bacterium]
MKFTPTPDHVSAAPEARAADRMRWRGSAHVLGGRAAGTFACQEREAWPAPPRGRAVDVGRYVRASTPPDRQGEVSRR